MNRIALIVSVVALIVSFTVWAINSPSSPFYDHDEPYLNGIGIGATINTSSKTAHERYYVNDSIRVGIGYTNDQPSSKLIINSGSEEERIVLNSNSTMEIYNVGKGFQYRKIIINTNQTRIVIKGREIIENVSMLIWDRENNSIAVN